MKGIKFNNKLSSTTN